MNRDDNLKLMLILVVLLVITLLFIIVIMYLKAKATKQQRTPQIVLGSFIDGKDVYV